MIELALNTEIYSEDKINQVQTVYREYAVITKKLVDQYWILKFDNCRYDESLTIKEFENYLIGLENL